MIVHAWIPNKLSWCTFTGYTYRTVPWTFKPAVNVGVSTTTLDLHACTHHMLCNHMKATAALNVYIPVSTRVYRDSGG